MLQILFLTVTTTFTSWGTFLYFPSLFFSFHTSRTSFLCHTQEFLYSFVIIHIFSCASSTSWNEMFPAGTKFNNYGCGAAETYSEIYLIKLNGINVQWYTCIGTSQGDAPDHVYTDDTYIYASVCNNTNNNNNYNIFKYFNLFVHSLIVLY